MCLASCCSGLTNHLTNSLTNSVNVPGIRVIINGFMLQWDEELARQAAEEATTAAAAAAAATTVNTSDSCLNSSSPSTLTNGDGCCGRGTCGSRNSGNRAQEAGGSNLSSTDSSGVDGSDLTGCSDGGVGECANSVKKVRIGVGTAKPNLLDFWGSGWGSNAAHAWGKKRDSVWDLQSLGATLKCWWTSGTRQAWVKATSL